MIINGIEWSDEDIKMVEKFDEINKKGHYVDGKQLTDYYNRLLNKRVNPTNCSSCLKQRCSELVSVLNYAKRKASEALKDEEPTTIQPNENKASESPLNKPKRVIKRAKKK